MSDVGKGFNVTIGIILALIFVFVILPTGACVGCVILGAGVGGVTETKRQALIEEQGPEVSFEGLDFKIVPRGMTISDVSYKFTVKNNRDVDIVKSFDIKFLDAEGFPATASVILREPLPAGSTRELTGSRLVKNELAATVSKMIVEEK